MRIPRAADKAGSGVLIEKPGLRLRWILPDAFMLLLLSLLIGGSLYWYESRAATRGRGHIWITTLGFGASQAAVSASLARPFGINRHVGVDLYAWDAENMGALASILRSPDSSDVIEVPEDLFLIAANGGLFQPLPSDVDSVARDTSRFSGAFGAPSGALAQLLVYRPETAGAPIPSEWRDLWNLQEFPGGRALRDNPRGTLEIALIADGVVPRDLYPLDVTRALNKLDALRVHVRCWWSDDVDAVRHMVDGDISVSVLWNSSTKSREFVNGHLAVAGAPGEMEARVWAIPAGSANRALAVDFIRFATNRAQVNAREVAGAYSAAHDLERTHDDSSSWRSSHPDYNQAGSYVNAEWWAENGATVDSLWEQWRRRGGARSKGAWSSDPPNLCAERGTS